MEAKKYAMVINLKKCLGCKTCTVACCIENSVLTTRTWNIVLDTIEGKYPDLKRSFLPRPCMHCQEPPCVPICPTGASYQRKELGVVLVDHDKCIGCRTCMTACPYEARVFNWEKPKKMLTENPAVPVREKGVVEKCTFCIQKLERAENEGLQIGTTRTNTDNHAVVSPACVRECVGKARYFGDLNDPNSEVVELLEKNSHKRLAEQVGTEPKVYYIE